MPQIARLLFKENSVRVELDNSEVLNLSYDVYAQYKLSSGMIIEGNLYFELFDESKLFECREKSLRLLAVRSRSVDEIRKHLKKKNFSEPQIAKTVEFLLNRDYLNDYEYAIAFVRERMRSGRYGKDIIVRDLFRKGISRKITDRAIKECGASEPDEENLYRLALKKFNSVREKDHSLVKTGNYLRQRGFDYESIKKVLRRLGEDDGPES